MALPSGSCVACSFYRFHVVHEDVDSGAESPTTLSACGVVDCRVPPRHQALPRLFLFGHVALWPKHPKIAPPSPLSPHSFFTDELVITVSAEGLAPGDGCPVAALDQFELTWFKHKDLAMIKLKRTAGEGGYTSLTHHI